MDYYKKNFNKEINLFSVVLLSISLLATLTDLIINFHFYPHWVNMLTISTIVINLVLLLLAATNKIDRTLAFVILSYIFTINIYLPGFWGDNEMKQFVISAFTNMGACFALVICTGLLGARVQSFVLGALNISLILTIYLLQPSTIRLDYINIVVFAGTTLALSIILKKMENALEQREKEQKRLIDYEKQLAELIWKEEQKRVVFLSRLSENNQVFLKQLSTNLSGALNDKSQQKREEILKNQIRECKNQQAFTLQLEFSKQIKDVDSEFYIRLKHKYPGLTSIEEHLCSLLRYNLSSNELSTQLHKSAETIKWYRKRIRKKLNLAPNDSLAEFCNKI